MDDDLRRELMGRLAVPLWPTAGRALGLGREATYAAFKRGELPGAFKIGKNIRVSTPSLRRLLGLNEAA